MIDPIDRSDADDAFGVAVRRLVDWHRDGPARWRLCDGAAMRLLIRDGYRLAAELVPPYGVRGIEVATATLRAAHLFRWTFWNYRLDPRDLYVQERYWGVIARALDESLDAPT